MQKIFDASLSAGVMQINNQTNLPRYEWQVYYIDAMCHSNKYQPQIPTAQKKELRDLSADGQLSLFRMYEAREFRVNSPYLSPETKAWHRQVHWMQDNNALYYCEKVLKHKDFGWGIYEG